MEREKVRTRLPASGHKHVRGVTRVPLRGAGASPGESRSTNIVADNSLARNEGRRGIKDRGEIREKEDDGWRTLKTGKNGGGDKAEQNSSDENAVLLHGVKDEATMFIGYLASSRQTHATVSLVQATQQDISTQPEKVISSFHTTDSEEERSRLGRSS